MRNLIRRAALSAALILKGLATHAEPIDGRPAIVLVHGILAVSTNRPRVTIDLDRNDRRAIALTDALHDPQADGAER